MHTYNAKHQRTKSSDAGVVKLVYTTDSKSVAFGRGGSSPPTGTILRKVAFIAAFRRFSAYVY